MWVWTRRGTNRLRWWPGWVAPHPMHMCKSVSLFTDDAGGVVAELAPRMRFAAPYDGWDTRSERPNPVVGARVRKRFVGYGEWEGRVVEAKAKEGGDAQEVEVEWGKEGEVGVWRERVSARELEDIRVGTTTVVDNVDDAVAKLRATEQAVLEPSERVRGARGWTSSVKVIPTTDADGEWARACERAKRAYRDAIARAIAYEEMMRYTVQHSAPSPQGVARAGAKPSAGRAAPQGAREQLRVGDKLAVFCSVMGVWVRGPRDDGLLVTRIEGDDVTVERADMLLKPETSVRRMARVYREGHQQTRTARVRPLKVRASAPLAPSATLVRTLPRPRRAYSRRQLRAGLRPRRRRVRRYDARGRGGAEAALGEPRDGGAGGGAPLRVAAAADRPGNLFVDAHDETTQSAKQAREQQAREQTCN